MPNRSADALFQLIQSLRKSEKRNFKLYVKRNWDSDDLKVIQLFDALDKMKEYDEAGLLKRNPSIKKAQLSNIKAKLYSELLASLRLLADERDIDIQLHEQLDYARILYNRGLYHQSLRMLEKIRELARANHQVSFLVQVHFLEKKIETLHITRSLQDRAEVLACDSDKTNERLVHITKLSNLALQLYGWYIQNGHARNEADEASVRVILNRHLPAEAHQLTGFYERLYLYQSYCWYAYIRQDFLMYYRYTQKWVDLFEEEPLMKELETAHYIKGLHNLLTAQFNLRDGRRFRQTLLRMEEVAASPLAQKGGNNQVQSFVYLYTAKINSHFMDGRFEEGLALVPEIEQGLEEYALYLDRHRVLVFYYKIASLYFGSGDFSTSIDYLHKIIHWKVDLRDDLQCYARLLHLIAHFELGNYDVIDYLVKSTYRFMAKMESLSQVEERLFRFLRNVFSLSRKELPEAFRQLHTDLKQFEHDPLESRTFTYLDILSWLESKIEGQPIAAILRKKIRQPSEL